MTPQGFDLSQLNRVIESCESTNDLIRAAGEAGAPHGSWISALEQTRGRGRQGREWISTRGNLFLSILLRPRAETRLTWLPLHVAYAIRKSLSRLGIRDVRVKWPNDLFLVETTGRRSKVGGILCEGVSQGKNAFVVAGIGLNTASAPASGSASVNVAVDRARAEILRDVLETFDHPPRAEEFEEALLFRRGETLRFAPDPESPRTQEAVLEGLGPSGEILLRSGSEIRGYFSGEIRISVE